VRKYFSLIFSVCFTLAVACAIFYFSAQPATISATESQGLAQRILELLHISYQVPLLDILDSVLRKCAHFCLYFLLGCGLTGILRWQRTFPQFTSVVILGGLYAASDEFHQLFVDGRAGMLSDVLLDTCGVAVGSLVLTFLLWAIHKKRQNHGEPCGDAKGSQ
jgi:VanZ family protein